MSRAMPTCSCPAADRCAAVGGAQRLDATWVRRLASRRAPEHRRGHSALYDAVDHGRIDIARLWRSLAGLSLPRSADGRLMLAIGCEQLAAARRLRGGPVIAGAPLALGGRDEKERAHPVQGVAHLGSPVVAGDRAHLGGWGQLQPGRGRGQRPHADGIRNPASVADRGGPAGAAAP